MRYVIFDLDGVIYRGLESMPYAADCVADCQQEGIKVGFLTNNSGRTRANISEILAEHKINASENEIMTSGVATAKVLLDEGHSGKRIYVVGRSGLTDTLNGYGFDVDSADEGEKCDFVVVGWDREITFNKIARAQEEIYYNGAELYATNADAMFPAAGGKFLPGAGSMVAAIERASDAKAIVIGKPESISLKLLLSDLGYSEHDAPSDVWMVGDRLDTDIVCGNKCNATTVLVTTGIASREMAERASGEMKPEHIIDSLDELLPIIRNSK